MTSLNAVSSNTNNDSFIASLEENIFNRLNNKGVSAGSQHLILLLGAE
jgi:hypothetical protein